jgi:hypothetical protein
VSKSVALVSDGPGVVVSCDSVLEDVIRFPVEELDVGLASEDSAVFVSPDTVSDEGVAVEELEFELRYVVNSGSVVVVSPDSVDDEGETVE